MLPLRRCPRVRQCALAQAIDAKYLKRQHGKWSSPQWSLRLLWPHCHSFTVWRRRRSLALPLTRPVWYDAKWQFDSSATRCSCCATGEGQALIRITTVAQQKDELQCPTAGRTEEKKKSNAQATGKDKFAVCMHRTAIDHQRKSTTASEREVLRVSLAPSLPFLLVASRSCLCIPSQLSACVLFRAFSHGKEPIRLTVKLTCRWMLSKKKRPRQSCRRGESRDNKQFSGRLRETGRRREGDLSIAYQMM